MKKHRSVKNIIFLALSSFMLFLFILKIATLTMPILDVLRIFEFLPFCILESIGFIMLKYGTDIEVIIWFFLPYFVIVLSILFMYLGIYKKRLFSIPVYIIFILDLVFNIMISSFAGAVWDIIIIAAFIVAMKNAGYPKKKEAPDFVLRGEWAKL